MTDTIDTLLEELRDHTDNVATALEVDPPDPTAKTGGIDSRREWYLVGLIGGKEVGKSALVNALVGDAITESTSYGPGTERVVAYVHEDRRDSLTEFLEREVPGRYEVVSHTKENLSRQVLLDLPDIDSRYAGHLETTRRMIRFMEYPIWIQSVEKYADAQSARILRKVAGRNVAENFVFCLNKVDQVRMHGGAKAVEEIRADFAERIGEWLELETPPKVESISAIHPEEEDLPALRERLGHERSENEVRASRNLAKNRQARTLLDWIADRDVPGRLDRVERVLERAENDVLERLGEPLFENILPALENDPNQRAEIALEAQQVRAARWPVVNLLQVALSSIVRLVKLRFRWGAAEKREQTGTLVNRWLTEWTVPPLQRTLQAVFASLQAMGPEVGEIYARAKYWEEGEAERSQTNLREDLIEALERRDREARARLDHPGGIFGTLTRLTFTLGAIVWFPFGQPVLEAYLSEEGWTNLPLLLVQLLGTPYLLRTAMFLGVYFLLLWLFLRWDTVRQVDRIYASWSGGECFEESLSLYLVAEEWMKELLSPLVERRDRLARLKERTEEIEWGLDSVN